MAKVYDKRENAIKHRVTDDASEIDLSTIAEKYQANTEKGTDISGWEELAMFNWGTVFPNEVNRALLETVGCSKIDPVDPGKTVLKPDPDLAGEILIPKIWKKDGLALKKQHTVKVKRFAPAPAVSITKLSKWFIPETESCDIEFRLEGVNDRADKVTCEIYASNYCKATPADEGEFAKYSFTKLDEPVFAEQIDAVEERGEHTKNDWFGESKAADGCLKPHAPDKAYVDAAHSPYTVLLRYYKIDADKDARLILHDFWPRFDFKQEYEDANINHGGAKKAMWTATGKAERGVVVIRDKRGWVVARMDIPEGKLESGAQELAWDGHYRAGATNSELGNAFLAADEPYTAKISTYKFELNTEKAEGAERKPLVVAWECKGTRGKLKLGHLRITDKDGKVVFLKPLKADWLSDGPHEWEWEDGTYTEGVKNSKDGDKAIWDDMPYRVEIQAHSDSNEKAGLALAAMHTEVRLYVHAETGMRGDDPVAEPQGLQLGLADWLPMKDPSNDEPTEGSDAWYRWRLAKAGYHAGPTGADAEAADLTLALKEFQRSVPETSAAPHKRIKADGAKNDATKKSLKDATDESRKLFGNPTDRSDLTLTQAKAKIGNKEEEMIVWIEDRHATTNHSDEAGANGDRWMPQAGFPDKDDMDKITDNYGMEDYRGSMDIGDRKRVKDAESIARPWLPVEVTLPLLSKSQSLSSTDNPPEVTDAMRRAVGPIRIDWSFDELPPDIGNVPLGSDKVFATLTVAGGTAPTATFRLRYDSKVTDPIAANATAADVVAELEKLGNENINFEGIGGAGGPWKVSLANAYWGPAITTLEALSGPHPDSATVGELDALSGMHVGTGKMRHAFEVKRKADVTGGTFTLSCDGEATPDLPHDADAAAIKAAVEALPAIKVALDASDLSVSVTTTGTAVRLIFTDESGADQSWVAAMTLDQANLLVTSAEVAVGNETVKATRARKWMNEILTRAAAPGTAKKKNGKLYTNCPEKIGGKDAGGIRPDDLDTYYKAPFGLGKRGGLLPWLPLDDTTAKAVTTLAHCNLGQDAKKVFPKLIGKAGIYLHPSRIAGDGYRFRARASFAKLPGNADHPNRKVLAARYLGLPQVETCALRLYRKSTWRGYVSWVPKARPNALANLPTAMNDVSDYYRHANVHFAKEGGGALTEFEVAGVHSIISADEYKKFIEDVFQGSFWDAERTDADLTEGYTWPFLHKQHFAIWAEKGPQPWGLAAGEGFIEGDIATAKGQVYDWLWNSAWTGNFLPKLTNLLTAKVESKEALLRGHLVLLLRGWKALCFMEYKCDNPGCAKVITEVANHPGGTVQAADEGENIEAEMHFNDRDCFWCKPAGVLRFQNWNWYTWRTFMPQCGSTSLGGVFVNEPQLGAMMLAHEVGHDRHLQHAQAESNKMTAAIDHQDKQHDSQANPALAGSTLSAHQQAWDRCCTMSYDWDAGYFCGKCLLKNRGWAVEDITKLDGAVHD